MYHSAGSTCGGAGFRQPLAHTGIVVRDGAGFGLPGVACVAVPDDGGARLTAASGEVVV